MTLKWTFFRRVMFSKWFLHSNQLDGLWWFQMICCELAQYRHTVQSDWPIKLLKFNTCSPQLPISSYSYNFINMYSIFNMHGFFSFLFVFFFVLNSITINRWLVCKVKITIYTLEIFIPSQVGCVICSVLLIYITLASLAHLKITY